MDNKVLKSIITRLQHMDKMYDMAIKSGKAGFMERQAIKHDRKTLKRDIEYLEGLMINA